MPCHGGFHNKPKKKYLLNHRPKKKPWERITPHDQRRWGRFEDRGRGRF